jgi:hypothetical protein
MGPFGDQPDSPYRGNNAAIREIQHPSTDRMQ